MLLLLQSNLPLRCFSLAHGLLHKSIESWINLIPGEIEIELEQPTKFLKLIDILIDEYELLIDEVDLEHQWMLDCPLQHKIKIVLNKKTHYLEIIPKSHHHRFYYQRK